MIPHFVQLFFYHVLISQSWFVATLFGNSLWLIALIYYVYINFLGYNSLGILQNTRAFLYPLAPIVVFIIGTLIGNWNLSKSLVNFYHYRVLWSYFWSLLPRNNVQIEANVKYFMSAVECINLINNNTRYFEEKHFSSSDMMMARWQNKFSDWIDPFCCAYYTVNVC